MLEALGQELKQAREDQGVSLEAIASPAKISTTYLHKLERGQVNNPSPRVLARLAVALDVDYLRLMELAGYLDEVQLAQVRAKSVAPHPLAGQQLQPDEWEQVGAFIRELIAAR